MKSALTPVLFAAVLVLAVLTSCSSLRLQAPLRLSEDDWMMFGRDPHHSHRSAADLSFPLTVAWKYDASAGFGAGSPVAVDGVVFVGTLQGELHAINARTGKRIGFKRMAMPISAAPVIEGSKAFIATEGLRESLFALDLTEDRIVWSANLGGVGSSPLLANEKLFVGSLNGTMYCLDPRYGNELWHFDSKKAIHSSPCATDSLIVFGDDGGIVYALRQTDGTAAWQFTTDASVFGSPCVAQGIVFIGSRDHYLYALDAMTGELLWKYDVGDRLMSGPSVNDSLVFIGALNGSVNALSLNNGKLAWTFEAQSVVNVSPVVTTTAIVVASLDRHVYALAPTTGRLLWKYDLQSRIKSSPIVWKDELIVSAEDRYVYCFRPEKLSSY